VHLRGSGVGSSVVHGSAIPCCPCCIVLFYCCWSTTTRRERQTEWDGDVKKRDGSAASPDPTSEAVVANSGGWLAWFATSNGAGALGILGLVVSVASFLTSTSITPLSIFLSIFGALVFGFLAVFFWLKRKRPWAAGAAVVVVILVVIATRAISAPGTTSFWYRGAVMGTSAGPLSQFVGIPLTTNPVDGRVDQSILPDEPAELEVSCTQDGTNRVGKQSTGMEWARVEKGNFQTLWVPVDYLRALAPGSAHTLLPCSS
jgi:hypothetical protein